MSASATCNGCRLRVGVGVCGVFGVFGVLAEEFSGARGREEGVLRAVLRSGVNSAVVFLGLCFLESFEVDGLLTCSWEI